MNCWRCACMFEASLWNKAPSASGGLTAGENLIRHFKDSSHWSLTENKTDQTSLSRNEREREHCRRLLYGMCNSPGFPLLLQMTPNGQTVCMCVRRVHRFVCCKYQRGCVATLTGSAQMSVFSGVDHYLWWLILIHWELASIPSSELSVFGLVQWTCEINVICLRDVRQLSFCLGQYLPCHHLE